MNLDWGSFFSSGVEEIGEIAKAKDVSIKAEAKASAEEFAEKQESYNNDITTNKQALTKEVESISGLVNGDVGKIRTIMKTYGNADVVKQLQTDFEKYQTNAYFETPTTGPQFKTLSEYVNGKISGAGTAIISDKAAEQVNDENAIAGNELNMVKAAKDAKAQGVSLSDYLDNQARRMSTRPAFSVDAKAARLVEESKMGIFGKTLTMEEARQKVTGGQVIGEDAKDLGDTGFALTREGGIGAEQLNKMEDRFKANRESRGLDVDPKEMNTMRANIAKTLSEPKFKVGSDITGFTVDVRNEDAIDAALTEIKTRLQTNNTEKGKNILLALQKEFELRKEALKNPSDEVVSKDKKIKQKRMNNNKDVQEFMEKPTVGVLKKLAADGHKYFLNENNRFILIESILKTLDKNNNVLPKEGNVGTYIGKNVVFKDGKYRIFENDRLGKVLNPSEIKNIVKGS
jgi:hypothetical protein